MTLTHVGALDGSAVADLVAGEPLYGGLVPQAGDFTPNPSQPASYLINKGSAAAITLAAPVAGTDDGKCIQFISATAFAHVITATGLLRTGSAAVNTATTAAQIGAQVVFMAFGGKWFVQSQVGITFA
jgi:hypothetical protein